MAKLQFKDLGQLQRYLERGDIVNKVFKDKNIKAILAQTMSQAVYDVVYGTYVPVGYKRRRNNGGLSDVRNMNFTKVEVKNGQVIILFENLTLGQTHQVVYNRSQDTLQGDFLTDTIVDGIEDNFERQGEWSKPRDFISETINRIKNDPSHLINAIKDSYKKLGFEVR